MAYKTNIPKPITPTPREDISGGQGFFVGGTSPSTGMSTGVQEVQPASIPQARPAKPSTANIPVAQIKPAPSLNLPQPALDTTPADGLVMGAKAGQKGIQDYVKELDVPDSATQIQQKSLISDLQSLLPQTEGKTSALQKEENKLGVNLIKKEITDLNNSISQDMAAYESAINREAMQTGNISSIIKGRQAVGRMVQASDIGLKQARLSALMGNLEGAMETASRAVDLRYADVTDQIATKEAQLEVIAPLLEDDETQQALALTNKLADEKVAVEEKKADQKANLELAFTTNTKSKYANKGGKIFRVSDGFADWTPEEALKDMGVSSWEEAYAKGLITDIDAQKIADMDFVLKLREEYADAGILFNDDVDTAITKLGASNKYYKENYIDSTPELVDDGQGGKMVFNPETGLYEPVALEGGVIGSDSKYVNNNGGALKLGVGQVDTLASFDNTQNAAETALNLLNEGVKTGSISGRVLGLNKFLGNSSDKINKQMELEQRLAQIKADFMKALSGAAVSEQEQARLSAFLPSINDQESVIKSKLNTLRNEMETKRAVFLETLGGQVNPNFGGSESTNPKAVSSTQGRTLASVVQTKYPDGSNGGQCGDFARRVVTSTGRTYPRLGDGLNSKVAAVQKYGVPATQASTGDVVVTRENPTYGHVAVVLQKTPQGVIVGESNFKQSNKVSYGRLIPYNKIVGAIKPTA